MTDRTIRCAVCFTFDGYHTDTCLVGVNAALRAENERLTAENAVMGRLIAGWIIDAEPEVASQAIKEMGEDLRTALQPDQGETP